MKAITSMKPAAGYTVAEAIASCDSIIADAQAYIAKAAKYPAQNWGDLDNQRGLLEEYTWMRACFLMGEEAVEAVVVEAIEAVAITAESTDEHVARLSRLISSAAEDAVYWAAKGDTKRTQSCREAVVYFTNKLNLVLSA